MIFKKKTGYVSKTFLASMVIFNLVFTTAATPVVSLAFDGESLPATQVEGDSTKVEKGEKEEKGDTGEKEEKGEKDGPTKEDPSETDPKGEEPTKDEPTDEPTKDEPTKEEPKTEEEGSTTVTTGSSGGSSQKGEVKGEETASCDFGNLIVNGGFENPNVTNSSDWDIYANGTSGLGWDVAWTDAVSGAPEVANLEIHNGVNGWPAYVGSQYAELDSDWRGPADPVYGEEASTVISQTINTIPGYKYTLRFAFAARPGTSDADNKLAIYIDGGLFDGSTTSSGEGLTNPYWIVREYVFTAYNSQTEIAFADIGNADSNGTFIDDVRVNCYEGESCPSKEMIYARIMLTPQPYGWRNWGNGNTSEKIFVGGNNSNPNEIGGNVYADREWFPLTNPDGSFIEDADISSYRDVPGIAVQRENGSIRVVLYGFLYEELNEKNTGSNGPVLISQSPNTSSLKMAKPDLAGNSSVPNYYMLNRELSQASIEFSNDMSTRSTTTIPVSQKSDPVNPFDFDDGMHGYIHTYHPMSDNFRIMSNLSQFHMVVTTGSDGFYTYYQSESNGGNGDCDGEGEGKTGTLVVSKVILGQGNGTFHFNGPNGSFDITTANGSGTHTVVDLAPGEYDVTEMEMAGWDIVSNGCVNVVVVANEKTDCTIVNTLDDGNPGCEGKDCPGETTCKSGEIWARVNVDEFMNAGTGNASSNIYLGSNANVISSGEWFMVYDGTNYINDADITAYEDVAGIAVQRLNGKIRVVQHGSGEPAPEFSEAVIGSVEFFNGLVTSVSEDNSGNNGLEDGTNGSSLDLISFAGDHAYFDLQVTTNDDGFYVNYEFSLDEECEDEDPGVEIGDECFAVGLTDFPWSAIVLTNNESGEYHLDIFDLTTIDFETPGTYPLTYTIEDSEGNVFAGPFNYNFVIVENVEDCDNGGGNGQSPEIAVTMQSCISTEALSYDFAAGANATDAESGNLIVFIDSSAVVFGTAGTYDVIYSATDANENTTTITIPFTISVNCDNGTGGGDDENPTITTPGESCVLVSAESFDFLAGVTATDAEDGDFDSSEIIVNSSEVQFGTVGSYTVTYSVTDSNAQNTTVSRTINISEDCDDDNGGGGGGGGGGSSSSGSRGGRNRGEVLGAETGSCVQFTQYHDTGSTKSEVKALQTFLNEYMDAGLSVNGIYDRATTQAIHNFQALHWDEIIKPWMQDPSQIGPNTTGRTRQTTMMAMDYLIECPVDALYLEDPMTMYAITNIKNAKPFTQSQIDKVTELLIEAQSGSVAGATTIPEGK